MKPRVSLVIPAHNEEGFLPGCLAAAREAASLLEDAVEIIVVLNRCTDGTEEISRAAGCVIVREDEKNLSVIRNRGVRAATADIVVTCDADSRMHRSTFVQVVKRLSSEKRVGGGAMIFPERWSLGIIASAASVFPYLALSGVSFGLFWFRREDFDEIGGFDPRFISVEDLDFARRLKRHGMKTGRRWGTLLTSPLVTSCRKFDEFGDWYFFLNPRLVRKIFRGDDRNAADHFWYDVRAGAKGGRDESAG